MPRRARWRCSRLAGQLPDGGGRFHRRAVRPAHLRLPGPAACTAGPGRAAGADAPGDGVLAAHAGGGRGTGELLDAGRMGAGRGGGGG